MEPILIVSATIVVVALALLAAQARVPGGHVGMVLRGGRVVRVATAGQRVVALPLVDTVRLVPVSPATLEIPALSALTRDGVRVDVAVSGVLENIDQVRADAVRVLAVTGDRRVPGVDAPTLREAGVPLEFSNWRGLVAPPGLSAAQRARLVELVTRMHDSAEWQRAERANGWTDDFLTGDAFGAFLARESDRVGDVLDRLGV